MLAGDSGQLNHLSTTLCQSDRTRGLLANTRGCLKFSPLVATLHPQSSELENRSGSVYQQDLWLLALALRLEKRSWNTDGLLLAW